MPLIRLIYASRVGKQVRLKDVEDIALGASARNSRNGITGFLLYSPEYFIQILEGEAAEVDATFARISRDQRHHDVHMIVREPISSRGFDHWHMGFAQFGRLRRDGVAHQRWDRDEVLELLESAAKQG